MLWRRWLFWRPPCVLRVVICNLKSDPELALRGLLWGYRGGWLTLRNVEALRVNAKPATVDGEVVVERDNVSFLQVMP
jgi:hypothetical protein